MNYDGWYLERIKVEVDMSAVMKNEPQLPFEAIDLSGNHP